jgi:hypothetical protein
VVRAPLQSINQHTSSKAIQTTTQDIGYYALGGLNLSKVLCSLHLQVLDLGATPPTIYHLEGIPQWAWRINTNTTSSMIYHVDSSWGGGCFLTMIRPDHVILNKTTHQRMRYDCSCFIERSQILAGFARVRYPLCLLSSCMAFRSLNEFIKFSKKIGILLEICPRGNHRDDYISLYP